jgi:hypothetical protein
MIEREVTVDSITLIVGLLAQFGGIVWQVSRFKSQLAEIANKVDKIELETKHDRESIMPIVYKFPILIENLERQLVRFEGTIKELREEIKESKKKQ